MDPRGEGPPTVASVERDTQPGTREGQRFGRFEILDVLGAGGMGTVFEARDPTLDRAVALKLLHPDAIARGERRVLREAQALAKLSHPNVVQVFEAGIIDGRPFIAMELVRGDTLTAWQASLHGWREVLAVYLQAGLGLAAAHAQGLVHRDFKPSNCILDAQGRVRVLDFGLARPIDAAVVNEARASRASFDAFPSADERLEPRTLERGAPGTLGYMPLEQLWGQPLDAKSDQFSFCVSLFEATHGRRPFTGESVDVLVFAMVDGAIDWPPGPARVPPRLRRLLERGLQARPEARWPSMDELLRELEQLVGPRRRRGWRLATGGGLAATVVLGATLWQARPLPCEDPRAALDEDWGPARREQVAVALEGGADRVPPETLTRLDAYAERWIAAHDAVCAAERGEIIDTAAVATRHECVAEAREALGDLALLLAQGESSMLTTIPTWIDELPDLARCDEPTAYVTQRPVPADPALAEAVRSLRLRRALATSKHMSSDYEGAVAILDPAVVDATALGHAPVLAELELARGNARLELGRYDAAEHDLEQAYARAVEHQHPHVALSAAIALAYLVGDLREHHDVGFKWGLTAEALARQPWSRPARLADVMEIVGNVLYEQGRFAMAFERYEQALEIRDGLDPDNPLRSLTIGNMGLVRHQQGRYAEALPFIHEALEQRRADFEPTNPAISVSLTSLAETLHQLGQHAEALRCYQEALEIRAQSLGWAHPQLVDVLVGLGRSWLEMGEPTRALHAYERALAISKEHDPSSSDTADAWLGVAQVLSAHGQLDAAVRHAGRGVRMLEQTVGPRHVHLGAALGMLGELEHEAGERASAREHLERAVEILAPSEGPSTELAAARLALARVLWTFLGERDAARVLAEQSLDASLAAGDPARAQVEAAKAWLAAHEAG